MLDCFNALAMYDEDIAVCISKELRRQRMKIELTASENFASKAVLGAVGTILTNKYAVGYPGDRSYGGCEFVDEIEDLARQRAQKLFGAEHVNVQPHSGCQANQAVYFAALEPGDVVLAMKPDHGGHFTHGSAGNLSGKYYNFIHYGVRPDTGRIDYEEVQRLARKYLPKMIIAGASVYPRFWDFKGFKEIADEVGALLMVDMAHIAGLVAAGLHPSPVPYADFVTATTHKTLRGPRGGLIICKQEWAEAIDKAVFPGIQGGSLMHVIAGKAVAFKEALQPEFIEYQRNVVANAKVLAQGLIEHGFTLCTNGTDNHLLLVDLRNKGINGKDAEAKLDQIGIIVNENVIPFDPESSVKANGIRLGTPAVTSRGFNQKAMWEIAEIIDSTLTSRKEQRQIKEKVRDLCARFPLYN